MEHRPSVALPSSRPRLEATRLPSADPPPPRPHAVPAISAIIRSRWLSGLPTVALAAILTLGVAEGCRGPAQSSGLPQSSPAAADNTSQEQSLPQETPARGQATQRQPPAGTPSRDQPAAAHAQARQTLMVSITIFVLSIFVGVELITKVPATLHTPLMSGSNAISGITVVGALIAAGSAGWVAPIVGLVAVVLATINVVGGFLVTHRMLRMFDRR